MQKTFKGIQLFKVQTRDFMFCDVQRRFLDPKYPSSQQMQQIKQEINEVDESGAFRAK